MEAKAINFLKFLQGTKQFAIPIYQRTYSWTQEQCKQLWDDILTVAKDENASGHFIGSIVYVEKGLYQISAVPQLLVIDGQQRLTTLSLLMAAFGKVLEENPTDIEISRRKIENYYLFNSEEDGELRYKLVLTQGDKGTLKALLDSHQLPQLASPRVTENYYFFLEQLRKLRSDLRTVYQGINKLLIVDIALNRDHDNPQLIFESLNSTGLELSQADLIRNYVLMGLDSKEQTELYNKYWRAMEQSFGHTEYTVRFDLFVRDYLTVKTRQIPNIRGVYSSFKTYALASANSQVSISQVIADLYRYSKYYTRLAFGKEPDPQIREALADVNLLEVEVAYPFLLEVYNNYENGLLSKEAVVEILRLIESYVFRRAICGIPTNSLNKTFATISREVDPDNYVESVKATLLLKGSYTRFPSDEEFSREFVVKDIYHLSKSRRSYLFRKLENFNRKEKVDIGEYTIEHILPQNENLSKAWQQELGPDWEELQKTYLHTIGNLTLTGYNPELSDHSFLEKRNAEGGYADSPIRLNRNLAKLEHWNEAEIQERANQLAQLAIKVWPVPALASDRLDEYRAGLIVESLDHTPLEKRVNALPAPIRELFEELRLRILGLDSLIRERLQVTSILYEKTHFALIVPTKKALQLHLKLRFDEIVNPGIGCKPHGVWKEWTTLLNISTQQQLEDAMKLVSQALRSSNLDVSLASPPNELEALFSQLRYQIASLDANITENVLASSNIYYKKGANHLVIFPRRTGIDLWLKTRFDTNSDPKSLFKVGNGNMAKWSMIREKISTSAQLDDVMKLVAQAFEKHKVQ